MRKIDYAKWKEQRHKKFLKMVELENTFEGRAIGRRPRDPGKEKVLSSLDKARYRRYIESGKLQIIEQRKWKWRVDFRKRY